MKTASAVIGANYGDEGKGLITDYLCAFGPSLNVRFNGGAQAGHTVVLPDGRRHVFSHFGAGTLSGAETLLSEFFLVNPIMFKKELFTLAKVAGSLSPRVWIDEQAQITTPWDMMLNQELELNRGDSRHGSCGLGIGETVERSAMVPLTYLTLVQDRKRFIQRLFLIRDRYFKMRLELLNIKIDYAFDERIMKKFIEDCEFLASNTFLAPSNKIAEFNGRIVFEGAQGLKLDQNNKRDFPHLTRSNTGLQNVFALCVKNDITQLDVHYVTRTYLTRHGAGPIENHMLAPYSKVSDLTNVHNNWQGHLRYGLLDRTSLLKRIEQDHLSIPPRFRSWIKMEAILCVTHGDQLDDGKVRFTEFGEQHEIPIVDFTLGTAARLGSTRALFSMGPTRKHIYSIDVLSQINKAAPEICS